MKTMMNSSKALLIIKQVKSNNLKTLYKIKHLNLILVMKNQLSDSMRKKKKLNFLNV
jgi:hypothetical protein